MVATLAPRVGSADQQPTYCTDITWLTTLPTMRPQLITVPPGPAGLELVLPAVRRILEGAEDRIALVPQLRDEATRRQVRAIAPNVPVAPGSLVLATSGSTGDPVGVTIPATALLASARAFATWSRTVPAHRPDRPLRWLASLPLTSIGGLMCAVRSLADGGPPEPTPWLGGQERFTAAALMAVTQSVVHPDTGWAISLVPTMLARVLAEGPAAISALTRYDVVLVGGAALGTELHRQAREAGIRVVTSYGMTETCGGAVMDGQALPGVVVRAIPSEGVLVEVGGHAAGVQVGRLQVFGPVVAAGYRDGRLPESWIWDTTTGQRGFQTSDLGSVDHNGAVAVLGRMDDIVQVGGVNVATSAVAAVLSEHPAVCEAAVAAVPDPQWGARLVGFVVIADAAGLSEPELRSDLRSRVRASLGRLAVPAEIQFCLDLPRLPGGKTDRAALERAALEQAALERAALEPAAREQAHGAVKGLPHSSA